MAYRCYVLLSRPGKCSCWRTGARARQAWLALGLIGLLICCVTLPYVVSLMPKARGIVETWELALAMGMRNLLVTGPLFCLEFVLVAVTPWTDPLLFLPGLGAGYAYLLYVTAAARAPESPLQAG